MPSTDLFKVFGIYRNPFVDRTAEKTELDEECLYTFSDLRGFGPSEKTYLLFGRRGSGKTTIRLRMMASYDSYNKQREAEGKLGHFVVDLCTPGHVTTCLREFQAQIRWVGGWGGGAIGVGWFGL